MASITKKANGSWLIQFKLRDGRHGLVLTEATDRQADEVKRHVEHLVAARIAGLALEPKTARWVARCGPTLRRRLAKAGLIEPERKAATDANVGELGAFMAHYLETRSDLKSGTLTNLRQCQKDLVAYFGADKRLDEITPGDSDEFRLYLVQRRKPPLGENSARRICGRANQFFRAAARKGLIQVSPFADMKGCAVRAVKERFYFVSRDEAQAFLDACPDAQWRLLFALARYGGLRSPSETLGLRWGDVDWERKRMNVRAPKTEHIEGRESRMVPIFPELRPYLEEAFRDAQIDGHRNGIPASQPVITRYRDCTANLRTQFGRIIRKAGLTQWCKPFQNCRATRQTELAQTFPQHVVCAWMGNTQIVAVEHYLRTTDADFERATTETIAGHTTPQSKSQSETLIPVEKLVPSVLVSASAAEEPCIQSRNLEVRTTLQTSDVSLHVAKTTGNKGERAAVCNQSATKLTRVGFEPDLLSLKD